jgi:hypothetical protein
MSNQYWTAGCWVILVSVFLFAGCERGHDRQEEPIEYNPLADANVVIADYASGAIKAAGGRKAWTGAEKLVLDGVVTFYRDDGSFYLTEQRHELRPWLNSIKISASEPQGAFVWQWSKGGFRMLEGASRESSLPIRVCEPYFAKAVLDIVSAPARLAERSAASALRSGPVKLQGQWYWRIKAGEVRGYDYREVRTGGVRVPTKIEVFNAAADGSVKEQLAQIDYHGLSQG